jgi:CheY-like chemotaxis protein
VCYEASPDVELVLPFAWDVMPDTIRASAKLTGFSVLIVENDMDNRDLLAEFLRQYGAQVATAQNATVALDHLDGQRVDTILTDVSALEEMGVARFISEVRSRPQYESTPIIAVTGWSPKDAVCSDGQFSAFMQKPVDLDQLEATIQRLAVVR